MKNLTSDPGCQVIVRTVESCPSSLYRTNPHKPHKFSLSFVIKDMSGTPAVDGNKICNFNCVNFFRLFLYVTKRNKNGDLI